MQAWEQEVAEIEIKYAKRVDEDEKILALKSIMPETLFGEAGVFRGRSFSTYAELRTSIIRYLDDKVPVSMMTKSSSSSVTTSFVQNLIEEERENEGEDKDSITQEELFAMVQLFRKGKGKGKGQSAGTVAIVITTAEIARTTSKTVGQNQCGGKATQTQESAKVQAKDGTQEKAFGTVPKAKGKSGNRTENGAQRRARVEAMAKEASTALMELLKVTGGHNQTLQTLKKIFISASIHHNQTEWMKRVQ